jgi:hypothetical protein
MSRLAPPTAWPVGPNLRWQLLHVLAYSAAAASLAVAALGVGQAVFTMAGAPLPWLWPIAAAVLGASLGWCAGAQCQGRLAWSGQLWQWQPEGADVAWSLHPPRVAVDTGGWLLVQARRSAGGSRLWFALQGPPAPAAPDQTLAWAAFRAALYSSTTPSEGLPGTRPADPE